MPTTINELIAKFDLSNSKVVKWKEINPAELEGIYIVSLSKDSEKKQWYIRRYSYFNKALG